MNYQIPLMNLVERGHLRVKNVIATKNFINKIDNDTCGMILESLLYNVDSRDCARILDECMETYDLRTNNRLCVSESTLNQERDKILVQEGMEDDVTQAVFDESKTVKDIVNMVKHGMIAYAVYAILRIPSEQRIVMMNDIKKFNRSAYNVLVSQPQLKKILPPDGSFFPNLTTALWTGDLKPANDWLRDAKGKIKLDASGNPIPNHPLMPTDIEYLSKVKNFGKNVALVTLGVTSALIAISVIYRKFFSMEAKARKGVSGKQRTSCMCNAIIKAAEIAKKKSEEQLLQCDSAKDPEECRYKMKVEIRSWSRKIEEQQRKLAKLQIVNSNAYPVERPKDKDLSKVRIGNSSNPFDDSYNVGKNVSELPKTSPVDVQSFDNPDKTLNNPFL